TNHWDFTHKGNRAERVQTVNAGDGGRVLQAGLEIQVLNSSPGVAQWLGLAHQFVEADAAECDREGTLRLADGRDDYVVEQRGHRPAFAMERYVDDGGDCEEPFASEQRHPGPRYPLYHITVGYYGRLFRFLSIVPSPVDPKPLAPRAVLANFPCSKSCARRTGA